MIDRRQFLVRTGSTLGAAAVLRSNAETIIGSAESRFTSHESLSRIGVQLYTVRDLMRQSADRTLEQLARIGYKEIEFWQYHGRTAKELRAILDVNGLTSPSAHTASMPAIRNRFAQVLDDAVTLGHRYVLCASVSREEMTADGYKRIAGEFNRAGEQAAKAGIKVGFHNHSDDLAPLGDTTGYDILLTECDPKVTAMQMDLFWTVKGGKDPLAYFAKYPGRFYSVHVKDMAAGGAMVDVGAGQLPFAKYFAKAKSAGVQHYFIEHDDPKDAIASLAAGYKHIKALNF